MNAIRCLPRCLLGVSGLLGLSAPATAAPAYEDRVEDYVVRSGDTIADITEHFLGDETFWEDNWKLNPQVRDPDRLRIGQVLRIIVARRVIAESARVVEAVNQTEKMLQRPDWQPAATGDEIGAGQGLRTRERSTAELRFNTESTLRLAEFSQVFLTRKETTLRGVDRGSVTVERGAVDLVFEPLERPRTDIELVAGPATAVPGADPMQRAQVRAGTADDGGARVMVYAGRSDVAAGGATVAVPSGMGTRVPESGPPASPEPRLAAPAPEASALRWNYSNGRLHWRPVADAAAYVVEVCRDPDCRNPLQRHQVAPDALWVQVTPLPRGEHHWRVHALSASGLDGYVSAAASVEVSDATPDLEAPMLALRPIDGFVIDPDGAVRLGPATRFAIEARDERSGVARVEIRHGSGPWEPLPLEPLVLGAVDAPPVSLRAIDRLDQISAQITLQEQPAPR